jgi:hypothetical protein
MSAVTDEDQIREMVALWAQVEADRDEPAWSELFAEDGCYVHPGGELVNGRLGILKDRQERNARRSPDHRTTRIFGPSVIRVRGNTAESATDYAAFTRNGPDHPWNIVAMGRMQSALVKQANRWYFSEVKNHAYFLGNPPPERLPGIPRA